MNPMVKNSWRWYEAAQTAAGPGRFAHDTSVNCSYAENFRAWPAVPYFLWLEQLPIKRVMIMEG
jgi:hypothetical protein